MEYKFVAIDSSMRNTGVVVGRIIDNEIFVDTIHLTTTEKTKNKQVRASSDTVSRCRSTFNFVQDILKKETPNVVFAETPSGSQSSSAMKSYGITCMLIASINPPPIEVTPIEVKMASFGKKTASKKDMIDWAANKYPDLPWFFHGGKLQAKNEHIADAIAAAHAGIKTNEFKQLINLLR